MKRVLVSLTALLPALAFAHTGADAGAHHGFIEGLSHPFTGLDHMAAMIAVGVWSALSFSHSGRKLLAVPVAFAAVLLIGGLASFAGLALPLVEPVIAASLVVLGLLVATRLKMPLAAGSALVAAFALFHGVAHGNELPADQAFAALSGMVLGTLILHVTGILLGRFVLDRQVWLPRIAGIGVALFGASLMAF